MRVEPAAHAQRAVARRRSRARCGSSRRRSGSARPRRRGARACIGGSLQTLLGGWKRALSFAFGGLDSATPTRMWQSRQKLCSRWQLWHFCGLHPRLDRVHVQVVVRVDAARAHAAVVAVGAEVFLVAVGAELRVVGRDAELPVGEPRVVFHCATRMHVPEDRLDAFERRDWPPQRRRPAVVAVDRGLARSRSPPRPGTSRRRPGPRPPGAVAETVAVVDGHLRWIEMVPSALSRHVPGARAGRDWP